MHAAAVGDGVDRLESDHVRVLRKEPCDLLERGGEPLILHVDLVDDPLVIPGNGCAGLHVRSTSHVTTRGERVNKAAAWETRSRKLRSNYCCKVQTTAIKIVSTRPPSGRRK